MPSEQVTPQLEERKFALESEIRLRELAIKEAEAKRTGITAAQATVAGAIIALASGAIGAGITAWSSQKIESGRSVTLVQVEDLKARGNLEIERSKQSATEALERKKFETTLILEAIKTASRPDAIRNLKFFVAAGFVSDADGKIARLSDESLPSISAPSAQAAGRALGATGSLIITSGGRSDPVCTAVAVSPQHVLTASFCLGTTPEPGRIEFKIGERSHGLQKVAAWDQSRLLLLKVEGAARLETFLDRTRIREPAIGEAVYLAVWQPDKSVYVRSCRITKTAIGDNDFHHDCTTGLGSAGAIIVAVADDALLGLHHSVAAPGSQVGVAAKISTRLAELRGHLAAADPALPPAR